MVVNFIMNYNARNTSNFYVTRGMNGNRIQSLHSRFTFYYASCQAFPVVSYPDPHAYSAQKFVSQKRSITNHKSIAHYSIMSSFESPAVLLRVTLFSSISRFPTCMCHHFSQRAVLWPADTTEIRLGFLA